MKTKLLAAMIVVFMLHSVASAQDEYYIRTNNRINLRATYSLEGEKVETVPEGTILHVVGRFNRWLKIDRNGDIVWLADWVDYTRLDNGGGQEPSQSLVQFDPESYQVVDNCCQVDRQCNTENEWTSGYWAFQNNHCSAAFQAQILSRHPGVRIEGPPAFVSLIEQALDLLRDRAPYWYNYSVGGLHTIKMITEGSSGIFIHSKTFGINPPDYIKDYSPGKVIREWDVIDTVGGIVHEACHAHRWDAGLAEEGWRNELPCVQMQLESTEAVDPSNRQSPWLRNLIANIQNPDYWWWTD